jgi:thiamine-phosphate pyrophosphorylase
MDYEKHIYRVIDANLNRLREGLRVCEEYFRFVKNEKEPSQRLKKLRHCCKSLEESFKKEKLFFSRDSVNDPFATDFEARENERKDVVGLFTANIKRCQEAARVIEEFAKLCENDSASKAAKNIRFELYTFEKDCCENYGSM